MLRLVIRNGAQSAIQMLPPKSIDELHGGQLATSRFRRHGNLRRTSCSSTKKAAQGARSLPLEDWSLSRLFCCTATVAVVADQLWRQFRTWPSWAQIVGWILGFWVLVPLLIWRTSWHPGAKAAATAAFLVFVASLGAAEEPTTPRLPTVAEDSEETEPPPADTPEPSPEESPEPVEAAPDKPPAPGVASRVTRVVDGDTVEARYGGQEVSVRLIGIDTPETVHPSEPVGCLGREASAFTTRRLEGARINLEFDVERTDRYGRMLAYVWVGGKLFNEEIVAQGFANVSTYPPNVKYEDRFLKAQRRARSNNRGLWAPGACPEPAAPQPLGGGGGGKCDPNYKGTCVPIVDYDLDCGDISGSVEVVGEDKHGFDADGDGFGCESN